MRKISQGKYELSISKADAIGKFMQMQGVCREQISGESPIEFSCTEKGKISITNPPKRHIENTNSTILFAEVIEQDGKTYVSYYTAFRQSNYVTKLVLLAVDVIAAIFAVVFAVTGADKTVPLIASVLCLLFFALVFFYNTKEKGNAPNDSEILVRELEKRIEAVNLWDK